MEKYTLGKRGHLAGLIELLGKIYSLQLLPKLIYVHLVLKSRPPFIIACFLAFVSGRMDTVGFIQKEKDATQHK